MKKIFVVLIGFYFLICFSSGVFASSVSVWQGQYYTGTTFNVGTYTFNFSVYDSASGGSICFTNTTSLTTGNWGEWRTEQSPWASCNNASKDYFLNINIAGSDMTPRRRLTVGDFLRRDVPDIQSGNLEITDNISASYYFGDGSYLTGVAGSGDINSVQGDGVYLYNGSESGGVVLAFNESRLNATIDVRTSGLGDNVSWNESYADTKYILGSSEGSLDVNSSTWWASVSSWVSGWFYSNGGALTFNESKLNASIDARSSFVETDPYWSSNFSLYNSSWSSTYNSTYNAWAYNQTVPANAYADGKINSVNTTANIKSLADTTYLNLSGKNANQDVNITPYNFEAGNLTLAQKISFVFGEVIDNVIDGWIRINGGLNVTGDLNVAGNMTTEGIVLEGDLVNHRIYDNASCVIIKGDTSTMYIC